MNEVPSKILLCGAYGKLYTTPLKGEKIGFMGENGDFGVFLSLIEKS